MTIPKKFLAPLATVMATISVSQQTATAATNIEQIQKSPHPAGEELTKLLRAGDNLATYPVKGELHALILRNSIDGVTLAEHYSHRSYSSHSSHRSHYSSR
jgi:hypothetical protein